MTGPTTAAYELPDFHPVTGHLHACAAQPPICDCAAWLYCVAQDAYGRGRDDEAAGNPMSPGFGPTNPPRSPEVTAAAEAVLREHYQDLNGHCICCSSDAAWPCAALTCAAALRVTASAPSEASS